MWVVYDHKTRHFFWKKNNAIVTLNLKIRHRVSVVVNSLFGSSPYNIVTSEGTGYTNYTSCQFWHHKGKNHLKDLGVHERRILQAWKSVILWGTCEPEIHFIKYSLFRQMFQKWNSLMRSIVYLIRAFFPKLFNYQHMLHYIPEELRQHGTMAATWNLVWKHLI